MADKKSPSAEGMKCLCGCGKATERKKAKFITGHDTRVKALLIAIMKGDKSKSAIPALAKPFLRSEDGLCGFKMTGDDLKKTGAFKVGKAKKAAPKKEAKVIPLRRKPRKARTTPKPQPVAASVSGSDWSDDTNED